MHLPECLHFPKSHSIVPTPFVKYRISFTKVHLFGMVAKLRFAVLFIGKQINFSKFWSHIILISWFIT
jgi:hypothetical protein